MMIDSRTFALWVAAISCVAICQPSVAAKKGAPVSAASFDLASAISDPMSPVNPYNAGTDPITMPISCPGGSIGPPDISIDGVIAHPAQKSPKSMTIQ